MKKTITFFLALPLLFFVSCDSGKGTELRLNLTKGQEISNTVTTQAEFEYEYSSMDEDMHMSMTTEARVLYTVIDVTDSSYLMTMGMEGMKMSFESMGMKTEFDTSKADESNPFMAVYNEIVKTMVFDMEVSKRNEIIHVGLSEDFRQSVVATTPYAGEILDSAEQMFSGNSLNNIGGVNGSSFPEGTVEVGQTWTNEMESSLSAGPFELDYVIRMESVYEGIKDGMHQITSTGTMEFIADEDMSFNLKGTFESVSSFDKKTMWCKNSTVKTIVQGDITDTDTEETSQVTIKMTTDIQ